ncbi:MAG: glycosyltransferase family 39 protein [Lachnospiraceae bacterium]|nr:glycosyltransferase family 39 protein [Lachnospiraceae bacterium]
MKKTSLILSKIIFGISAVILLYLTLNAFHYSFYMNLYYYEGISWIAEGPDSRLKNILAVLAGFILLFLLSKLLFLGSKNKENKNHRVLILAIVFCAVILAGLIYFVTKTHISVECDQLEVFNLASMLAKGDYSEVGNYYFQMYPQQLGLAFFESIFLHFTSDPLIFQILNAIFISASVFFIYRLSHELFASPEISFFTLMLIVVNFPFYYYTSFVYGDVFMIFASLFISWAAIKYFKTGKLLYPILLMVASVIMIPVRKNSLVFLLALAIVMILKSLHVKKLAPVILAILVIILPLLFNKAIIKGYETKGETTIDNEMPAINWIAMGLYDAVNPGYSVGVYNMYNELTYFNAGRNTEASKEASKAFIEERLDYFKKNPEACRKFFRFKTLEQWTEPTFSSIDSTVGDHKYCWEEVKFSYDFHTLDRMSRLMNYVQAIAYFFSFIYMLFAIVSEKEIGSVLPVLAFVGGFLFSLIWEASGRYTYPYFIILLPIAAAGIGKTWKLLMSVYFKYIKKSE